MKYSHSIANDMLSTIGETAKKGKYYSEKGRGSHQLEGDVNYKITASRAKNGLAEFTLIIRNVSKTIDRSLVVIANGDDIQFIQANIRDEAIQACYEVGNPHGYPNFNISLVRGEVGYKASDGKKIIRSVSCDFDTCFVDVLDESNPPSNDIFCYYGHGGQVGIDPNYILENENMRMGDMLLQGLRHPRLRSTLRCVDKVACTGFSNLRNIIGKHFESYGEILNGKYKPIDRIEEAFNSVTPITEEYQLPDDEYIEEVLWVPKKVKIRG